MANNKYSDNLITAMVFMEQDTNGMVIHPNTQIDL